MSEQTSTPVAQKPDTLIVDADAHVNPPHDMWAEYLPESLREHAPQIEHGEDCDYVVFEGRRRKVNLIAAQAGRAGMDFKMEGRVSDARAGGWMPRARIEDMDQDGMDTAILFGGGPLGTANVELYKASFAAYNRWLADFCAFAPQRLAGVGYVPMQDVDEAIAMMRDCAKLGLKAINIPAFPMAKMASLNGGEAQTMALTGDVTGERDVLDDPAQVPFQVIAGIDRQRRIVDRRAIRDHHQDAPLLGPPQDALVRPGQRLAVDVLLEQAFPHHQREIALGAAPRRVR